LLSFTSVAASPTMEKLGRPAPRCASTCTGGAARPTCARQATRASVKAASGDATLELLEPRAGALEHARLRGEFVACDEIETREVGAQHGPEVGFEVVLQAADAGRDGLHQATDEVFDA
jgi:hypothetical protein